MLQYMSHNGLNMKMPFSDISSLHPEVDYQTLMALMLDQSHPRRKLRELQDKGLLIRLKKGFYVLSKELIGKNYSPEIVANLIYGPSYLSLEYALSFYHLIPERVEHFTSVTTQKNKTFATPLGYFTYQHLAVSLYALGVDQKITNDGRAFLIASPEKALMDTFTLKFKSSVRVHKNDMLAALEDDLRIDLNELQKKLNKQQLLSMQPYYRGRRWNKIAIEYILENL
jgi:predicted transcriptional regulator of viral defense system